MLFCWFCLANRVPSFFLFPLVGTFPLSCGSRPSLPARKFSQRGQVAQHGPQRTIEELSRQTGSAGTQRVYGGGKAAGTTRVDADHAALVLMMNRAGAWALFL